MKKMKKVLFMLCLFLLTSSVFASKVGKSKMDKKLLICEATISLGYGANNVSMKVSGSCAEVEAYLKAKIMNGWKVVTTWVAPPPVKRVEDIEAEREAEEANIIRALD